MASKIRIITVRRDLLDIAHAGPEELTSALRNIFSDPSVPGNADGILTIGELYRSAYAPLLRDVYDSIDKNIAVALRELLVDEAVRPVILADGGVVASRKGAPAVAVRAAAAVAAFDQSGYGIGVAAEVPVAVIGLAVDTRAAGLTLVRYLGRRTCRQFGLETAAASGASSAAGLAVEIAARCRGAAPILAPGAAYADKTSDADTTRDALESAIGKQGFIFIPLGDDPAAAVAAVTMQLRAAADYFLSGAAATLAAAALDLWRAARRAPPVAPPAAAVPLPALPALVRERQNYLLDRLARIVLLVPDDTSRLNNINELQRVGALGAYFSVLTGGRDDDSVEEFLERLASAAAKARAEAEGAARASAAASRARILIAAIEGKLGSKRMREIVSGLNAVARGAPGGRLAAFSAASTALNDPGAVLAALTKSERKLIELAASNMADAARAVAENKCSHVRLVRRLRTAPDARTAAATLADLERTYIAPPRASPTADPRMLTCRLCSLDVICPHVQLRIQLENKGASYDAIRERLERFAVRTGGDSAVYYCSCCAEQLAAADTGDESGRSQQEMGRFGALGSGLRTRLWALMLNALKHVRFAVPTDERRFANEAAIVLAPVLEASAAADAPGRPRRSGRKSAAAAVDETPAIEPRVALRAAIYTYAYLLVALQRAHSSAQFGSVRAGARASSVAEQMLQLISSEQGSVIAQLEDVSAEYLRTQFTAAYRALQGFAPTGTAPTATELAANLVQNLTSVNPIYSYALAVVRAAGALPCAPPRDPAAARAEFLAVLGRPVGELITSARANREHSGNWRAQRNGFTVPLGTTLEFWVKESRRTLFTPDSIFTWPAAGKMAAAVASFYAGAAGGFASGGRGGRGSRRGGRGRAEHKSRAEHKQSTVLGQTGTIRRPPNPAAAGAYYEAWRLFTLYTTAVTSPESLEQYTGELARYAGAERALQTAQSYSAVWPEFDPKTGASSTQQYRHVPVKITQQYDDQGNRHTWGKGATYIYQTDSDTELKFKGVDAVSRARSSGELPHEARLVDVECGTCGVRYSNTGSIDTALTETAVRAASEFSAFYNFYETRCPAGGIHKWVSQTCQQCQAALAVVAAGQAGQRTAAAREYYDKYAAAFRQERRQIGTLQIRRAPAAAVAVAAESKFQPDYDLVVEAATLAGTTPSVLEAIGASAGRDFSDVVEGHGAPDPPTVRSDPRIFVADATVRSFLADYYRLRASPVQLQELQSQSTGSADEPGPVLLPAVGLEYCAEFEAVCRSRPPAAALAFAIQSLCQFALAIAKTSSLGMMVAKNSLQNVVRAVRRFSKPGQFDWAIFSGERDLILEDELAPDQIGDVGEDVETAQNERRLETFSGEHIDYDTSEDNPNNEQP